MACFLQTHIKDDDFEARFAALKTMKREQSVDVKDTVAAILADVRARGDAALIELTEKFDHQSLRADTLQISQSEIDAADAACDEATKAALALAAARIADFHARQKPEDNMFTDAVGVELGHRWSWHSSVQCSTIPAIPAIQCMDV